MFYSYFPLKQVNNRVYLMLRVEVFQNDCLLVDWTWELNLSSSAKETLSCSILYKQYT